MNTSSRSRRFWNRNPRWWAITVSSRGIAKAVLPRGHQHGPVQKYGDPRDFQSEKHPDLERFCAVVSENLAELVRQLSPKITARDVAELSLLTLGAQLYGSNNNAIGKQATLDVFFLSSKS